MKVGMNKYMECLDHCMYCSVGLCPMFILSMSLADCHLAVRTIRNSFLIHEDCVNYK